MTNESRPAWSHKIPEETARWLLGHRIVKISHKWEMTSADTSRDWIVLETDLGKTREFESDFFCRNESYFRFQPNHASLISLGTGRGALCASLEAIDAWEQKNKRDRAEFDRLKRKFGGA